jgi:hypothetical protein
MAYSRQETALRVNALGVSFSGVQALQAPVGRPRASGSSPGSVPRSVLEVFVDPRGSLAPAAGEVTVDADPRVTYRSVSKV